MGNSAKSKKADSQLESNNIEQKLQDSGGNQEEEYGGGGASCQRDGDQVPEMKKRNQQVSSHQLDDPNQSGQGQLPRTISWKDFKGEELVSVREYQPSEDGDRRGVSWCCTVM